MRQAGTENANPVPTRLLADYVATAPLGLVIFLRLYAKVVSNLGKKVSFDVKKELLIFTKPWRSQIVGSFEILRSVNFLQTYKREKVNNIVKHRRFGQPGIKILNNPNLVVSLSLLLLLFYYCHCYCFCIKRKTNTRAPTGPDGSVASRYRLQPRSLFF